MNPVHANLGHLDLTGTDSWTGLVSRWFGQGDTMATENTPESGAHGVWQMDVLPTHSIEVKVKTKREIERQISQAIIRFEKEFMGRGPLETRTFLIEDIVLVRLKNVLTPAELKLAESEEAKRGRYLIKQVRQELIEQGRPLLDAVIQNILGIDVISLHTDISARTGERIIVFTLEREPDLSDG